MEEGGLTDFGAGFGRVGSPDEPTVGVTYGVPRLDRPAGGADAGCAAGLAGSAIVDFIYRSSRTNSFFCSVFLLMLLPPKRLLMKSLLGLAATGLGADDESPRPASRSSSSSSILGFLI